MAATTSAVAAAPSEAAIVRNQALVRITRLSVHSGGRDVQCLPPSG